MKKQILIVAVIIASSAISLHSKAQERFLDGTPVSDWFRQIEQTDINKLGKHYRITEYGVIADSTKLQTEKIQAVIDKSAENGGGVVIIPQGTFLSGSLFFKANTHLYLEEGAVLKGSDDISDFDLIETRIEGQTLKYFAALVNADRVNGFTVSGKGTLDGNGLRYWKAFWLRRQFNPQCTNMDEMRPRVLYVSNSKDVQISGIRLINSPFWTSHYYRCENLKLLDLYIYAPEKPVKAPSSDAIDLDNCHNVLVKNCYMSVNDDAIALKGGKGPLADRDPNNGPNSNIIIEDCEFGFCHSTLTCGSESIHSHNVIYRRNTVDGAKRVLQLKMRPDTPQKYENILMEDVRGNAGNFIFIQAWTQFFDMKGQAEKPLSYANNITFRNIDLECDILFNAKSSELIKLSNFTFDNVKIKANKNGEIQKDIVKNLVLKNVVVNGEKIK